MCSGGNVSHQLEVRMAKTVLVLVQVQCGRFFPKHFAKQKLNLQTFLAKSELEEESFELFFYICRVCPSMPFPH